LRFRCRRSCRQTYRRLGRQLRVARHDLVGAVARSGPSVRQTRALLFARCQRLGIRERGRGSLRRDAAPRLGVLFRGEGNEKSPGLNSRCRHEPRKLEPGA
jgi:hypothetical protein